VPCRATGRMVFSVGYALADGLVRAGRCCSAVILGQDGAQVGFARISIRSQDSRRTCRRVATGAFIAVSLDGLSAGCGAGACKDGVDQL